jgi:hypothetical protein
MRRTRSAAGIAVLVLGFGACGGDDEGPKQAAVTTTTTAPVTPTVPASSTTTIASAATGEGAFLTAPTSPTVKPAPVEPSCRALIDDGYDGSCRLLTAPSGTVAYVSQRPENTTGPGEVRVLVWRRQGGEFSLALRWADTVDTSRDAPPSLRAIDLAQDNDPKVVAVFYEPGSGGSPTTATVKAVDVVEASGEVTLHRSLDHGVARQATGGGLETWSRLGGSGSDRFLHEIIRYRGGAWRVETSEEVAGASVPREKDETTF